MLRLASLIYALVGPTLAGSLIVLCLVIGLDTLAPILIAALLGFGAGVPVAWRVAQRLEDPKS